MVPAQIPRINPAEFSRCEEAKQKTGYGKSLSSSQKTDAAKKGLVDRAIWNDDVLRAIDYYKIDVHVKNRVVYLNGHIGSTTSQRRIKNALRAIPGILGLQNNLVLDDRLTLEVATSLGNLEHTYDCKFLTGATHGVVSLNGIVSDENVKLLAEKCVASNPNVRAVINNVRVSGAARELQVQPFLQPIIGEMIYFLDGIHGVVRQVIINPNNRRVTAMILRGQFANQEQELKSLSDAAARSQEQVVVVSMDQVRHLTKVSGFLHINSNDRQKYMDFDATRFSSPTSGWKAPYPYCPDDVLFPIEHREVEVLILAQPVRTPLVVPLREQALWEQPLADESLGGS